MTTPPPTNPRSDGIIMRFFFDLLKEAGINGNDAAKALGWKTSAVMRNLPPYKTGSLLPRVIALYKERVSTEIPAEIQTIIHLFNTETT